MTLGRENNRRRGLREIVVIAVRHDIFRLAGVSVGDDMQLGPRATTQTSEASKRGGSKRRMSGKQAFASWQSEYLIRMNERSPGHIIDPLICFDSGRSSKGVLEVAAQVLSRKPSRALDQDLVVDLSQIESRVAVALGLGLGSLVLDVSLKEGSGFGVPVRGSQEPTGHSLTRSK